MIKAVNQETDFQVTGIYGSPLEAEWHPAAAYVLRKEMQRFEVLQREFQKKTSAWRFEFAEMVGGKTVVFVYHLKQLSDILLQWAECLFCLEEITSLNSLVKTFAEEYVFFKQIET